MARPPVSQPKGELIDLVSEGKAVKIPSSLLVNMQTNPISCLPSISSSDSSVMADQCSHGVILIDLENETELIRPNPFLIAAMRTDHGAPQVSSSISGDCDQKD